MTLAGLSISLSLSVIILHYLLTSKNGKSCHPLWEKLSQFPFSFKGEKICYCHLHNEGLQKELSFNKKVFFLCKINFSVKDALHTHWMVKILTRVDILTLYQEYIMCIWNEEKKIRWLTATLSTWATWTPTTLQNWGAVLWHQLWAAQWGRCMSTGFKTRREGLALLSNTALTSTIRATYLHLTPGLSCALGCSNNDNNSNDGNDNNNNNNGSYMTEGSFE